MICLFFPSGFQFIVFHLVLFRTVLVVGVWRQNRYSRVLFRTKFVSLPGKVSIVAYLLCFAALLLF